MHVCGCMFQLLFIIVHDADRIGGTLALTHPPIMACLAKNKSISLIRKQRGPKWRGARSAARNEGPVCILSSICLSLVFHSTDTIQYDIL